ncbi:MAG: class I SAM-dependent methyltransferase [Gaiellales bacterium]
MGADAFRELTVRLGSSTEAMAALGAALRLRVSGEDAPTEVQAALDEVVAALGLEELLAGASPEQLAAMLAPIRALLLQSLDLLTDPARAPGWTYTDAELLESQGRSSAGFARVIRDVLAPTLPGLEATLGRPGATFVDVGVGVGGLAIEMCRVWPSLRVIGIDPWDYVLAIARRNVAAAGLADRIELRQLGAEQLDDESSADLLFLPGPFLPPAVLEAAVERAFAAIRPGGWVILGLYGGGGRLEDGLARLRTARSGGALFRADQAEALLARSGFVDVRTMPGGIAIPGLLVVGRRST